MVLGALLILAAAALLAYNKWDASRADKASQEVLGELEQTLNAAIEEKAKSDTVALSVHSVHRAGTAGDEPVELCGPENRTGPLLRFHLCG